MSLPTDPDPPELAWLLAGRPHCRVVHHLPGRLRLRLDFHGLSAALAGQPARLEALLGRLRGIQRTEVNPGAASVVIHYDPAQLPDALWQALLNGENAAARAALLQLLPPAPPSPPHDRTVHGYPSPVAA